MNWTIGTIVGMGLITSFLVIRNNKKYFAQKFDEVTSDVTMWVKSLGIMDIITIINTASSFLQYTEDQRKQYVFNTIKKLAADKGINIPDRYINLVIEYVYVKYIHK